jgi:sec-independent protein translocase protein TatA
VPFGLGVWEIAILVGVLVLLFGAKGVPDVARRLGTSMREVKDAVADVDPRRMLDAPEPRKPQPPRETPRDDA